MNTKQRFSTIMETFTAMVNIDTKNAYFSAIVNLSEYSFCLNLIFQQDFCFWYSERKFTHIYTLCKLVHNFLSS